MLTKEDYSSLVSFLKLNFSTMPLKRAFQKKKREVATAEMSSGHAWNPDFIPISEKVPTGSFPTSNSTEPTIFRKRRYCYNFWFAPSLPRDYLNHFMLFLKWGTSYKCWKYLHLFKKAVLFHSSTCRVSALLEIQNETAASASLSCHHWNDNRG